MQRTVVRGVAGPEPGQAAAAWLARIPIKELYPSSGGPSGMTIYLPRVFVQGQLIKAWPDWETWGSA